jgi:hypothetical protein
VGLLQKLSLKNRNYQGYDCGMDNHELLKKYRSTSLAFIQAAGEIKPSSFNSAKEGEWSPAFVIHHVADAEVQFGVRYANALAEDNPQVIPFDEEKFPTALQYQNRSVEASLNAMTALHAMNYEILKNATDADWQRVSTHPQRGTVTLFDLVSLGTDHTAGHVTQLKNSVI